MSPRRRRDEQGARADEHGSGASDHAAWAPPSSWGARLPDGPPSGPPGSAPRAEAAPAGREGTAPPVAAVPIGAGRSALAPAFVPDLPAPSPPRVRRGRLVVVGVALVMLLIGTMAIAHHVVQGLYATPASEAGAMASNTLPPLVVTRNAGADPTTTTTGAPKLDLLLLKGRPQPTKAMDDQQCARSLVPSGLAITDYRNWHPLPPPASKPLTEAEVRAEITTVMRRRFRHDDPDQAVADAMALYDSAAIKKLAGDEISLRGALVELKGTLGEPALAFVLATDRPLTLRFGTPKSPTSGGEAWIHGRSIDITLNERKRYERPAVMVPIVFHELLHQNGQANWNEELANNALDTRMAIESLRDYPEAIASATESSTGMRWSTLAQLNTRVGSQMTLSRTDGPTLFPGTTGLPVKTFAEYVLAPPETGENPYAALPKTATPGHDTLTQVLASMAGTGAAPAPAQFDDATLAFIDANAGVDSCTQLIVAQALGVTHRGTPGEQAAQAYLANQPG